MDVGVRLNFVREAARLIIVDESGPGLCRIR
jgi:hypothetical protein